MSRAKPKVNCPDCSTENVSPRRAFLRSAGSVAVAAGFTGHTLPNVMAEEVASAKTEPESAVRALLATLNESQRSKICFDWDHVDNDHGLLRTHVANNWNITDPEINSKFFTDEQRDMIRSAFEGIIHPDWRERYYKQLKDDCGGFGEGQSIAIFTKPQTEQMEFVLTGRHITLRCDGNTTEHTAFGGPIFYGHAIQEDEEPTHPNNVFWEQAVLANNLFGMLDGRQRTLALVKDSPHEADIEFRGEKGNRPGIPVSELSSDQASQLKTVLSKLVEPFRKIDADEIIQCLNKQGGLAACNLAFYQDTDIGKDGVWDNWRLEGPSFVWYFRGNPHVHVWVNVADSAEVATNAG